MKPEPSKARAPYKAFPCPLCQSSPSLFFSEIREYWFCETCHLIFVPSTFHISSEEEVDRYLEHENSLDNEGYVDMFRNKIKLIRQTCPKVKRILDYGCGYEPVLKTLLSREGYQVDGFDPNFFPEGKSRKYYDLIISTETFEHFQKPGKEIELISNLLDVKGYIAVMTRFYPKEGGGPSLNAFEKWYYKRDPSHIAFYTPETFEWIACAHNMDIILNNAKDFVIFRKRS